MKIFDKYFLLGALSLFFGLFAVSMIVFKDNKSESYMYTPAPLIARTGPQAMQEGAGFKSMADLSVSSSTRSIFCYPADTHKRLIAEKGLTLTASGSQENQVMEVYTGSDGSYAVFLIGPNAVGNIEACELSTGNSWHRPPQAE